jgi:hypothetical protein
MDSKFRIHAVGNMNSNVNSKVPLCYAYWEDEEWKSLGPDGVIVPYAIDCSGLGQGNFKVNFDLDAKEFSHIVFGGMIFMNSVLRYTYWDGENWNGRDWSQLHDGIHDTSGSLISAKYGSLVIDSNEQPYLCYQRDYVDHALINLIFNDLSSKQSSLSLGIITDKPILIISTNSIYQSV